MSSVGGFLGRWSRLKQQARTEPPERAEAEGQTEPAEPAVDLASLPPLETLDAASDYTPFLQAGVPAELRSQALRQAWTSDKAIADFRGLAEYDWDFNAPGYGQLWAADKLAQLAEALTEPDKAETIEHPASDPETLPSPAMPAVIAEAAPALEPEEPEPAPSTLPPAAAARRHGGALPS